MKRKQLDHLTITFENIQTITIPGKHVASYVFDNITFAITKDWYSENSYKHKLAHSTCFVLRPEADVETADEWDEYTVFDRILKFKDIDEIELVYTDKSSDCLAVYWDDGEYTNGYQTSEITPEKNLVVVIDPRKTAASKCREMGLEPDEMEKARRGIKY